MSKYSETHPCKTCWFWERFDKFGACHANSPTAVEPVPINQAARARWPETSADDWCGEHKQAVALTVEETEELIPEVYTEIRRLGLTVRACKTLWRLRYSGITRVDQLTRDLLLCTKNCGVTTTLEILEWKESVLGGTP